MVKIKSPDPHPQISTLLKGLSVSHSDPIPIVNNDPKNVIPFSCQDFKSYFRPIKCLQTKVNLHTEMHGDWSSIIFSLKHDVHCSYNYEEMSYTNECKSIRFEHLAICQV